MDLYKFLHFLQGQGEGAAAGGEGAPAAGGSQFLIVMLGMVVIFYFLLIRPQMKEQKRRKQMLGAVKKHDRVITNGGIHGVVVAVNDMDVTVKIDEGNNVRVKFTRSAIATILQEEDAPEKA